MFGETRTCNFVKQEYVPWCLVIQEYVNVIWCLVKKRACLLVSDEVRTFNFMFGATRTCHMVFDEARTFNFMFGVTRTCHMVFDEARTGDLMFGETRTHI